MFCNLAFAGVGRRNHIQIVETSSAREESDDTVHSNRRFDVAGFALWDLSTLSRQVVGTSRRFTVAGFAYGGMYLAFAVVSSLPDRSILETP